MTTAVLIGSVIAFVAAVLVYRLLPDTRLAHARAAGSHAAHGPAGDADRELSLEPQTARAER